MANVVIVLGKPNAGKGTRLKVFLNDERKEIYEHISSGDRLRKARKDKTPIGKIAAKYMDAGKLVPDDVVTDIMIEAIEATDKHVLLDGFPRTVEQVTAMLKSGMVPSAVIYLDIDNESIITRAKNRLICEDCSASYTMNDYNPPKIEGICDCCGGKLVRREDDEEEVVRERLETYVVKTLPVISTFLKAGVQVFSITEEGEEADQKFAEVMQSIF